MSLLLVRLIRYADSDQGTPGRIYISGRVFCHAIELPGRDNQPNYSRIPAGIYKCVWHCSPRYGWCYVVTGVPHRSCILIHPGNLAGDRNKGFKTHSHGCILLGNYHGTLHKQRAVLNSRPTIRRFNSKFNEKPFYLEVLDGCDSIAA